MRHLLPVLLFTACCASSVSAQSIADTYSFPIAIRSAGIHGIVRYSYIPPRKDTSGWINFPARVDARAFRSAPTVTRRGDSLVWTADSSYTSAEGNRAVFQNSITLVVDSVQKELTSIGVLSFTSEAQQAYQTDRARSYVLVGRFPYTLSDTALTVSLTGSDLRAALRKIDYSDRTTALLQGQLSATFVNGFDSVFVDDTARFTMTLAKLVPAAVKASRASTPILVYPNPADRILQLGAKHAEVFDLMGRLINISLQASEEDHVRLDVSSLPNGTYTVESDGRRALFTVRHR